MSVGCPVVSTKGPFVQAGWGWAVATGVQRVVYPKLMHGTGRAARLRRVLGVGV